jgi:hypothetical protein
MSFQIAPLFGIVPLRLLGFFKKTKQDFYWTLAIIAVRPEPVEG